VMDPDDVVVRLVDSCVFKREVLAVVAEGLNARGRWIPVAWDDKDISEKLLDRGCNMLPDSCYESATMADVAAREVLELMRTGRFKVRKELVNWLDEYKTFQLENGNVPRGTHPLMAATRHAVSQLEYARALQSMKASNKTYPKVAMI